MTEWDFLNSIMYQFPPVAATFILAAAGIIFIIGFSIHGINFFKYGFRQKSVADLGTKIDELSNKVEADISNLSSKVEKVQADIRNLSNKVETDINRLETELDAIKVNHFGHLKNFLTELTGILVDKKIISNENKARLDNHLNGM